MMANSPAALGEIEDLTLCSYCKQTFNEGELLPKLLACKHHFCLKCITTVMLKGRELYCVHCWKRTELPDGRTDSLPTHGGLLALTRRLAAGLPPDLPLTPQADGCPAHAMPCTLWCRDCATAVCRACATQPEHSAHAVKPHADARQLLRSDAQAHLAHMHTTLADVQRLVFKQRDFLLKILEACTTLKTQVETDLVNNLPAYELAEARDSLNRAKVSLDEAERRGPGEVQRLLSELAAERERLQGKHREMFLQCKLDDLIRNAGVLFDFDLLKQALANVHAGEASNVQGNNGFHNPVLFLANYCMSQLYSRHFLLKQQQNNNQYTLNHNGNIDFGVTPQVLPHPQYAPIVLADVSKTNHNYSENNNIIKPSIIHYNAEQLNNTLPGLNISKPSPIGYHDSGGSLNSPNLNKSNAPFQTDALALALPTLQLPALQLPALQLPIPPHPHNNLPSPPGQQMTGLLPPNILQHSPQNLIRNPTSHIYPIFYFNIEVNGTPFGRILIEVRNDVAPKMAKNFSILASGELGVGYKGCNIFQCWKNESIITGDFELNNGHGGRSVFEESFFVPDDTKILAIRGSVGMRRSQKRHNNLGMVGSQFRIILLREMRGFTGIFAFVVEGLELVDHISQTGDSAGKPQSNIVIASCGKFN